jgi:hypothetical protein
MLERNYLDRYLYRPPLSLSLSLSGLYSAWSIHPFEIDFWATVIKNVWEISQLADGARPHRSIDLHTLKS